MNNQEPDERAALIERINYINKRTSNVNLSMKQHDEALVADIAVLREIKDRGEIYLKSNIFIPKPSKLDEKLTSHMYAYNHLKYLGFSDEQIEQAKQNLKEQHKNDK